MPGCASSRAELLRELGEKTGQSRKVSWSETCSVGSVKHWAVWGGVALLGFVACSGGGDAPGVLEPVAGQGAGADGGTASVVPRDHAGAGAGGVGTAGEGGGGGQLLASCEHGLQPLRIVGTPALPNPNDYENPISIVSWSAERRVAVGLVNEIAIFDLEPASGDGSVRLVERLSASDAGLSEDDGFRQLFVDEQGLLLLTFHGRVLSWQPEAGFSELTHMPDELPYLTGGLADATHGVVIAYRDALYHAQVVDGEWSWQLLGSVPNRWLRPLAFDGDELLVGIEEVPRGQEGYGGEGGAGGASDASGTNAALLERWSLTGARLASYETLGDPTVAIRARDGWLIGETNSFWGSYRAAVEWLSPEGVLQQLAEVPVRSSGDGTDGAYDLALRGQDLLVANCESGLLRGQWSDARVELSEVPGPWSPDFASCSPSQVEIVGDVLVTAGSGLEFSRFCE